MSSVIYAIVFKGELVEGFKPISVKAHMAKLLKADGDKMKALFSGKQIVIKRTADKKEAAKYGSALKKIGADVKVRVIKSDAPLPEKKVQQAEPKATPATESPAVVDISAISLAPNEGNLIEPSAPPPPPDVDISGITVADNDGTPLVEQSEEEHADLDLSEYSVQENDGSPLVEASDDEVPEIEVPDFGLDEPGAVLETLQEEKELLNPNTSGMTLAMAGSDMLEPEERDQGTEPEEPDTSGINLVPNFD
ncbi:MAG: hypothetical protein CMQ20_12145 [Gammaproteobacteria bacterium]|jgi:hypothetical protein|nr:hypothetical protein [Gammaproteobacteria bacterium]|tara:strand:+ start:391 stop:1143 length:753 start_codon:yes stop_codon:yes gene_type:complete